MTQSADRPTDPAAVTVSLAAEAAVLEGRLGVLREAIDAVDAQISAVSERIRRLPGSVPTGGEGAAASDEGSGTGLTPSPTGRL
ncbi:hypothetical protein [Streptomyces sp. VRA16 Mangrove soil]|uniref:hypothetical protein n=1 Tax=Streptomyces sp. VRA16 Mangrove soil TaxID=2817434 RepID=UPI001E55A51C|nr:hypothetical protein [Streptomyces sp. VRA16 Mangrove soil]